MTRTFKRDANIKPQLGRVVIHAKVNSTWTASRCFVNGDDRPSAIHSAIFPSVLAYEYSSRVDKVFDLTWWQISNDDRMNIPWTNGWSAWLSRILDSRNRNSSNLSYASAWDWFKGICLQSNSIFREIDLSSDVSIYAYNFRLSVTWMTAGLFYRPLTGKLTPINLIRTFDSPDPGAFV